MSVSKDELLAIFNTLTADEAAKVLEYIRNIISSQNKH